MFFAPFCDEVFTGFFASYFTKKINLVNCLYLQPKSAEKCYIDHTCLSDLPQADISQFFDECVDFIDLALSFSMGKVFVSCLLGYSRQVLVLTKQQSKVGVNAFPPSRFYYRNAFCCIFGGSSLLIFLKV